ncbi:MAG: SDR family oxidoreductase [Bryobacteraceae bacterium]|jgi:NAD(P)-dependent dehydrogenase (short-subunit alcohol dehydrogenase family)
MQGKVVVVTGGTSGIGQVAAERLAGMGARVILVARSKSRGEAALSRLREVAPGQAHRVHYGDVSRLADLNRLVTEIRSAEPRIDVLINNAGAMFGNRQVTEDGMELTFATNHLSYFVLTQGLREQLAAAGSARIVNTSSHAHYRGKINFADLQSEHGYSGFPVYSFSKLCNVLFTRALSQRLAGTGITTNSLHPGVVNTRFADGSGGFLERILRIVKMFAISPEKGAETIVYLASSDDVAKTTGLYFYKCKAVEPSKIAQDDATAERLWNETEKLAHFSTSP